MHQLAISPTACVASTLDIGRKRRRVEATASSFTPSDCLATASLVVIEAICHEYLMMVRTNVWLPTLVDSGVPFGFLVTEVFMVHFLSADHVCGYLDMPWALLPGACRCVKYACSTTKTEKSGM